MKLTIELTDVSEYEAAAKALLALHSSFNVALVEPEVKTKAKKAKTEVEAPPAPEPAPEVNENQLEIDFEPPAPDPVQAAEATAPTLDEARDALSAYSVKNGMTAARALLEKYGAQRVSDIKDDQRAAFIAEMGA